MRKLLLDLGALNVVEEKTRLPANYPALGVEDLSTPRAAGTEVAVLSPAQHWTLIVGKSSGGKSGYVRLAGAAQSLLAAPLLSVTADPKSWLDTALIDVPAERVSTIEEHPSEGAGYSASRQKTDDAHFSVAPLPRGRELSGPGAADALGAALSGLTLDDASKAPAAGAAGPRALFRTFDGLELQVMGRKDGTRSLIMLERPRRPDGRPGTGAETAGAAGGLGVRDPGLQVRGHFHAGHGSAETTAAANEESAAACSRKTASPGSGPGRP